MYHYVGTDIIIPAVLIRILSYQPTVCAARCLDCPGTCMWHVQGSRMILNGAQNTFVPFARGFLDCVAGARKAHALWQHCNMVHHALTGASLDRCIESLVHHLSVMPRARCTTWLHKNDCLCCCFYPALATHCMLHISRLLFCMQKRGRRHWATRTGGSHTVWATLATPGCEAQKQRLSLKAIKQSKQSNCDAAAAAA